MKAITSCICEFCGEHRAKKGVDHTECIKKRLAARDANAKKPNIKFTNRQGKECEVTHEQKQRAKGRNAGKTYAKNTFRWPE